jgi:purine-binding chemotaxis protein CheW
LNQIDIDESQNKFLLFLLGETTFATPLIEVREVVEFREAKPIPHTLPYFKGVINIRGEIVGVIDLRERMNLQNSQKPVAMLIFETETGVLAALVDRVLSVAQISRDEIKTQSFSAENKAHDRTYYLGVTKVHDQIITVISVRRVATLEINKN